MKPLVAYRPLLLFPNCLHIGKYSFECHFESLRDSAVQDNHLSPDEISTRSKKKPNKPNKQKPTKNPKQNKTKKPKTHPKNRQKRKMVVVLKTIPVPVTLTVMISLGQHPVLTVVF